jgi:hypothetical protein
VLNNAGYIAGPVPTRAYSGAASSDLVNALACIGTAMAPFPVAGGKTKQPRFVTSRMLEAAIIVIGLVSLLAVVTLRQDLAGAPGTDTASLVTTGRRSGEYPGQASLASYSKALVTEGKDFPRDRRPSDGRRCRSASGSGEGWPPADSRR